MCIKKRKKRVKKKGKVQVYFPAFLLPLLVLSNDFIYVYFFSLSFLTYFSFLPRFLYSSMTEICSQYFLCFFLSILLTIPTLFSRFILWHSLFSPLSLVLIISDILFLFLYSLYCLIIFLPFSLLWWTSLIWGENNHTNKYILTFYFFSSVYFTVRLFFYFFLFFSLMTVVNLKTKIITPTKTKKKKEKTWGRNQWSEKRENAVKRKKKMQ